MVRGVWCKRTVGGWGGWFGETQEHLFRMRGSRFVGSEGVVEVVWDTWRGDGRGVEDGDSGSRIGERERGVATGGRWTSRTAVAEVHVCRQGRCWRRGTNTEHHENHAHTMLLWRGGVESTRGSITDDGDPATHLQRISVIDCPPTS